ncbi:hypothetical protein BCR39DRAFT_195802 [Naematelia encephala]|uniref:Uncharacterized protein n=1 Tax=Naematelia encephala TaxID=71784 RepID=A0A1Y2BIC3_9TREE|nr:hypothetical protein BCR39DRAFT_195802 [Naematelia encephala]
MTALSSASLSPLRPTTYNPPHSSVYHPVLSPPPTAESEIPMFYRHHQPPMHSAPPPLRRFGSSGNLHQQHAFGPDTRPELKRRSLSPDIMARPSNLPPSLAALRITRPRSEAPRLPSFDTPDQDITMDGSWAERTAAATDPARFRKSPIPRLSMVPVINQSAS